MGFASVPSSDLISFTGVPSRIASSSTPEADASLVEDVGLVLRFWLTAIRASILRSLSSSEAIMVFVWEMGRTGGVLLQLELSLHVFVCEGR